MICCDLRSQAVNVRALRQPRQAALRITAGRANFCCPAALLPRPAAPQMRVQAGSRVGHDVEPDQQMAPQSLDGSDTATHGALQQQQQQQQQQQHALPPQQQQQQLSSSGAGNTGARVVLSPAGLLHQASLLVAVSALALSLCLSAPTAATAGGSSMVQQQAVHTQVLTQQVQQQQQQRWQQQQQRQQQQLPPLHALQPSSSFTAWPGAQQQQQQLMWGQVINQQQQPQGSTPTTFTSSSSSSSSGSSWLARQQQLSATVAAGSSSGSSSSDPFDAYQHQHQHLQLLDLQQQQQQQQQQHVSSSLPALEQQRQQQHPEQQQLVFDMSSRAEDSMLEALRQFEAQVDRAVGALSSSLQLVDAAQASSEQAALDAQAQSLIREVWEVVDVNYMDARQSGFDHDKWRQLRDAALARTYRDQASMHRAVRDMLAQGVSDPYCHFIEPREFATMKKYDVTGVGLNLGTSEEFLKKTGLPLPRSASADSGDVWVVGLSKGSEAERAGIAQGDQLVQISGTPLAGITPFQAATLIAGPDDSSTTTSVALTVLKGSGDLLDVTVQRPARMLPSPVKAQLSEQYDGRKVGVIHLSSFNARALRDVSAALAELQQQGASELVLDLRDNRGGLVSEGLEVARLFLSDEVPIVLTRSKSMAANPPRAGQAAATQLPLTVLVNEHTASASEILAGALKDNCRGVLVGKRTYGKGLIQSVYELTDNSGLVITVGKYLTPRGVDIDRHGIAPNFSSKPAPAQAAAALNACKLEAGLQQAPSAAVAS